MIQAIGKSDYKIIQNKINLKFGKYLLAKNGQRIDKINFIKLNNYMKNTIIEINVDLGIGKFKRTVYSSNLTNEYIKINADYRT